MKRRLSKEAKAASKKRHNEIRRRQRFQCHEETRPWEVLKDCCRAWGVCLMFFGASSLTGAVAAWTIITVCDHT